MAEERGGRLGGAFVYEVIVCSKVPPSTGDSGVEGSKMKVFLEVSFELMDDLWSWPVRS